MCAGTYEEKKRKSPQVLLSVTEILLQLLDSLSISRVYQFDHNLHEPDVSQRFRLSIPGLIII
jgi:hypothetical protein